MKTKIIIRLIIKLKRIPKQNEKKHYKGFFAFILYLFYHLVKFILKLLKKHNISTNFMIRFRELVLDEKIGEGGYGEVFKGKWLG